MANSEFLLKLLKKRGIEGEKEIEKFLNPNYVEDLHDPFLFADMERACQRLYSAIENNEKIIIYADYDCDGIPGAVILSDLLKKIKYENYEVYIPERNSEGYGLNMEAIEIFGKSDVKLIITIDLGITAVEEVMKAKEYGMDVIITDHHLPKEKLPNAYAILNPKVDGYPGKMPARNASSMADAGGLCGAGVMFKFVCGFLIYIKKRKPDVFLSAELATLKQSSTAKTSGSHFLSVPTGWEKWLLDMAGLATLSDMVPLLGENRAIAYFGLKVFRKSPRPGLQKLLAKMSIEQKTISEDDIGFMVTPRLNAASRMDSPMRAFELLSTNDVVQAGMLATHLTKINDERKHIVLGYMKHVKKVFENREVREVIVIGDPTWRVGVLGLVAGKIADEYDKTVFVWGRDENDMIKGSCRSPGKCSVVELMSEASEHFLEYGGHELAGGFTVHNDKIHFLEEKLVEAFHKITPSASGTSPLIKGEEEYDLKLTLSDVNMQNWNEMEKMAPFGLANPKPVFLFENVKIEKIKAFGKNGSGEHLEITFSDNTKKGIVAISFFSGLDSFSKGISEGGKVNLIATFDLSRFRGRAELRLRIVDIF